jgi:hypothetical protein
VLVAIAATATAVFLWRARRPVLEPRAVWVWSDHVMRDPLARDSLFAWARRHGITRLYQHVEPLLMQDVDAVAAFLRAARAEGFDVEALLGDPAWLVAPEAALARIDRVLGLHDLVGTDTLAAIHLDVEPYGVPEWRAQEAEVVRRFQSLIEQVVARRAARTIPLHLDIPVWYDKVPVTGDSAASLAEWLLARADGITFMAYITDLPALWPTLTPETQLAWRYGTTVTVGVETSCAVDAETSFCRLGRDRLEATLAAVRRRYGEDPGWGGTAIHYYPEAVRLLP